MSTAHTEIGRTAAALLDRLPPDARIRGAVLVVELETPDGPDRIDLQVSGGPLRAMSLLSGALAALCRPTDERDTT